MDWNNAMKIARREAGIKELLMKARTEMFYLALNEDSYINEGDFEYLMDIVGEWANEYDLENEYEQANSLRALIKETEHEKGFDQYEVVDQFLEFLETEYEFYNGLGKKYDRIMGVEKPKEVKYFQQRLATYHPIHGWI